MIDSIEHKRKKGLCDTIMALNHALEMKINLIAHENPNSIISIRSRTTFIMLL